MNRNRFRDDGGSDGDGNDASESSKTPRITNSSPAVRPWGRPHHVDPSSSSSTGFMPSSYTVAWICAIPCELAAAQAMLDEHHPPLLDQPQQDSNHYTLGSIHRHNVVIACLPLSQYGTVNAVNVLTNLTRTFPSIRMCLMVGVGGGVPGTSHDVRLGDIVVGIRVMPYELGKMGEGGQIQHINGPLMTHSSLSTVLSTIRAEHESKPSRVPTIIQERFSSQAEYRHPGMPDLLFEAAYTHAISTMPGQCEDCDEERVVPRRTRKSTNPVIHYGAIGSGDKLIKHGVARDDLARKLNVICFEMEAAGLMSVLPCLPIRGICDYSDTHKNKDWQKYAAAAAAAFARELLETMPASSQDVESSMKRSKELRDSMDDEIDRRQRREEIMSSLEFPQLNARRQNIKKAHSKTCQWLLQCPEYRRWQDPQQHSQHRGFLWIRGKPGAGKSTLMKFLYDKARASDEKESALSISFFFHARGELLEQSIFGMYRSLLLQLLDRFPDLQHVLDGLDLVGRSQTSCPPLHALKDLFQYAVFNLGSRSLTCFVDALDEGDEQQIIEMIQYFEETAEQSAERGIAFRMCLSSRHYPYIDIKYGLGLVLEDQEGHKNDLLDYIHGSLRVKDAKMLSDLEGQLVQKSRGVFLWVRLVVDILNAENRRGGLALKKRLAEIPAGLTDLFRDIIARDKNGLDDLLVSITWILFSTRPLNPLEYHHAMWSALASQDLADDDMPDTTSEDAEDRAHMCVLSSSKGLAEVTRAETPTIQFIHESVRDYLIKDKGINELWPDIGIDWEAQSHENLKKYCIFYLRRRKISHLISESLGDSSSITEEVSMALRSKMPLFAYATQNILAHANAACASIPQEETLSLFSPTNWTKLFNICGDRSKRSYGPRSSLMYMLADRGLTNLIRVRIGMEPPHREEEDRWNAFRYPLFAAIAGGHKETVAALLGTHHSSVRLYHGYSDDLYRFRHAWSPLSWAARNGLTDVVSLLLQQGIDINEHDPSGKTPLIQAISAGHYITSKMLLQHNAKIDVWDLDYGVESAARRGDEPLMRLLIQLGADMNVPELMRCCPRRNPLYLAFSHGHWRVAELMVAQGAQLGDPLGLPIDILEGCHKNYEMMVEILIAGKKNADSSIINRQNLLSLAVMVGIDLGTKSEVFDGVDINAQMLEMRMLRRVTRYQKSR